MREILFRAKRVDDEKWIYGFYVVQYGAKEIYLPNGSDGEYGFDHYHIIPDTLGQYTGLIDRMGNKIFEGDILRFEDEDGIWCAPVIFERGLFGLDVYRVKQIQNPRGWDKTYDKVKSRGWGYKWGYEEFGTAFSYRQPLAKATLFDEDKNEYTNSEYYKWHEKFGWGEYRVAAEVVGNIYDNPELLEDIK